MTWQTTPQYPYGNPAWYNQVYGLDFRNPRPLCRKLNLAGPCNLQRNVHQTESWLYQCGHCMTPYAVLSELPWLPGAPTYIGRETMNPR